MKHIQVDELSRVEEAVELLRDHSLYAEGHCDVEDVVEILEEESSAVVDLLNQSGIKWSWTELDDEFEYYANELGDLEFDEEED